MMKFLSFKVEYNVKAAAFKIQWIELVNRESKEISRSDYLMAARTLARNPRWRLWRHGLCFIRRRREQNQIIPFASLSSSSSSYDVEDSTSGWIQVLKRMTTLTIWERDDKDSGWILATTCSDFFPSFYFI